jgi:hypothetical protein
MTDLRRWHGLQIRASGESSEDLARGPRKTSLGVLRRPRSGSSEDPERGNMPSGIKVR